MFLFFRKLCLLSFVLRSFSLWLATITFSFYVIWYARTQCMHKDSLRPIGRAFAYIFRSIHEANELQTGCMDKSVDDLLILKKLGFRMEPSRAPKIIPVKWSLS